MKNIKLTLAVLVISSATLYSFDSFQSTSIKGKVSPGDKAVRAWAVSSDDTLNAEIKNGAFQISNLKAGTYSVIIDAETPYAVARKKDVVVSPESPVTDIGEIKLEQK